MSIRLLQNRLLHDRRSRQRQSACRRSRRLRCESLEDRRMLSVAPDWVLDFDTADGGSLISSVGYDLDGNVYVGGSFSGTVDFDPDSDPSDVPALMTESSAPFLAKYSPDGDALWAMQATSIAWDMAVDAAGNVYIAGFPSEGSSVAKYDANGVWQWSATVSPFLGGEVGIAVDGNDLYLTGGLWGQKAQFGDLYFKRWAHDGYVAKMHAATGNFLRVTPIDGASGSAVAIGSDGAVYISGAGSSSAKFGSITLELGAQGGFIAELDANGQFSWAAKSGGHAQNICVRNGSVYATGSFEGTEDFDPSPEEAYLTATTYTDAYVVSLNTSGSFQWVYQVPDTPGGGWESVQQGGIAADATGNIYVALTKDGLADSRDRVAYNLQLAADDGFPLASWNYPTTGNTFGEDVAVDGNGNVYAVGRGATDVTYPSGLTVTSVSPSTYRGYIQKYVPADPNNLPPVANDDSASTVEDTPIDINVLGDLEDPEHDFDPDGELLTIANVTQGAHGLVNISVDNTVTYTPELNFHGEDAFTYTISDGRGGFDTASVTITVTPVQDGPPSANAGGPYSVFAGGTVGLDASGSTDPDMPFETLTYEWDLDYDGVTFTADVSSQTAIFNAGSLPAGTVVTVATKVTDSAGQADTATTTVTVEAMPSSVSYDYTGDPKTIGDLKTVTATINVPDADPITELQVQLNITHTNPADLTAWLVSPNGITLNITGPIASDNIVYEVTYPQGITAGDLQRDGVWTLNVRDSKKNGLRGTLIDWSLIVTPGLGVGTAAVMSESLTAAPASLAGTSSPDVGAPAAAAVDTLFLDQHTAAEDAVADEPTASSAVDEAVTDLDLDLLGDGLLEDLALGVL